MLVWTAARIVLDFLISTRACTADNVYVPKDRVTTKHKGHAFVEFKGEEDADYVRSLCQHRLLPLPADVQREERCRHHAASSLPSAYPGS